MLYSVAAFSLLTAITIFLYWESINILYKADYQFLADEVESLQYALSADTIDMDDLKQQVIHAPTQLDASIYKYYTRIIDNNNNVLIETPGIPDIHIKKTSIHTHITKPIYRWYSHDNTKYLFIQAPFKYHNNAHGTIQIILNISWQHAIISDRKYLTLALFFSALCSILLGFYITQRGMKSLYTLTDQVKNITATSLHQRIDPETLPKELKKLGLAFNETLDNIEASFVRLKQFSSDLAHELRMPINNLIGETEIVLARHHSLAEYQQVMMSNLEEYQRISHLIENILFLSRAENPQLELEKSPIQVDYEIAFICEYYEAMAEDKNISVKLEGKATVYANPVMFRRMISNLLSNALKYTANNGWVRFFIYTDNDNVHITLSDSGIGIAAEHLPKIFDRFYRVDAARSQESGGTGLGLAIVKSIVDMHHGSISIKSKPQHGTIISIILPSVRQHGDN